MKLEFRYDYKGRRTEKKGYNWSGAWQLSYDNAFSYDSWNLFSEANATNQSIVDRSMWGLDLSSFQQGAGGVGGLLAVATPTAGAAFLSNDGNGNISGLIAATNGMISGRYEYDIYGKTIRSSGFAAGENRFHFSSKVIDSELDLIYYGYRYLSTTLGKWLSRDPVGERGGPNLLGFLGNNPIDRSDYLGWGLNDPGGPGKCNACCSCPDSIRIANVLPVNGLMSGVPGLWWGHSFDVEVCLSYNRAASAGALAGPPSVQWFENSSRTLPGIQPNTWNDMFGAFPNSAQAQQWNSRGKEPCPGKKCFTIHDTPAIAQTSANTAPQHLEFHITVNGSCSSCFPMSLTASAVQDLTLNPNGTPATGTFTISP